MPVVADSPVLQVRDIVKTFPGVRALDGVSLRIEQAWGSGDAGDGATQSAGATVMDAKMASNSAANQKLGW